MKKVLVMIAIFAITFSSCGIFGTKDVVVPTPVDPAVSADTTSARIEKAPTTNVVVLKGKFSTGSRENPKILNMTSAFTSNPAVDMNTAYSNFRLVMPGVGTVVSSTINKTGTVPELSGIKANREYEFTVTIDVKAAALNSELNGKITFVLVYLDNNGITVAQKDLTFVCQTVKFSVGTLSTAVHPATPVGATYDLRPIIGISTIKTGSQSVIPTAVIKGLDASLGNTVEIYSDSLSTVPLGKATIVAGSTTTSVVLPTVPAFTSMDHYYRQVLKNGLAGGTPIKISVTYQYKTEGGENKSNDSTRQFKEVVHTNGQLVIEYLPATDNTLSNNVWTKVSEFKATAVGCDQAIKQFVHEILIDNASRTYGQYFYDVAVFVNNTYTGDLRIQYDWVSGKLTVTFIQEIKIPKGVTKTIKLMLAVDGFYRGDGLKTTLLTDKTRVPINFRFLNQGGQDDDGTARLYSSSGSSSDALPQNLIVSDVFETPHSASLAYSSGDWFNGYFVSFVGTPVLIRTASISSPVGGGKVSVNGVRMLKEPIKLKVSTKSFD